MRPVEVIGELVWNWVQKRRARFGWSNRHTKWEMGTRIPALLLAAGLAALHPSAQSLAQKFEVASVKRCQNSQPPSGGDPDPLRLHLACVTAANLVRLAYLVFPAGEPDAPVSPNSFQVPISGGPSWLDSDRYSIDAKAAGPVNVEMMKGPMMQALLADRFKLKLHREAKEVNIFELSVARGGPKLQPAKMGGCVVFDRNNPPPDPPPGEPGPVFCGFVRRSAATGFDIAGVTMADRCRSLSAYVDRDIIDKTGLKGVFDVHLDLTPADLGYPGALPDPSSALPPGDSGGARIASAVKRLGLQMRPAKGSAQFIVIDHVERPSGN
jgi:uncharacterized protein (TIGR03435 family)